MSDYLVTYVTLGAIKDLIQTNQTRSHKRKSSVPMDEAPILIGDDNELHLRTYKMILEGKGHSVMVFETGAAAIEKGLN